MRLGLGLSICSQVSSKSTFNPATLALTSWQRGSFTGSPWNGTASAGASGSTTFTEGTNPPSVGSSLNGFTPASFNGTSSRIASSTDIGSLVTASAGTIICLFNANTAATDAGATTYYQNPALFSDVGQARTALSFSSSGVRMGAFNSGTSFNSVAVACGVGGWHLACGRWNSTTLEVGVDSGSFQSISQTMQLVAAQVVAGANYANTKFLDGSIMEIMTMQSRISDSDYASIKSYINSRYGLSL